MTINGIDFACQSVPRVGATMIMALLVLYSVSLNGCSSVAEETRFAPVTGKVTYKGKPLSQGKIVMIHESGKAGAGEVQSDGTYRLEAVVGENKVMIDSRDQKKLSQSSPKQGRGVRLEPSLIPERYGDYESSKLQLTVIDGMNTQDWELVD
jgi:hypothetical protein